MNNEVQQMVKNGAIATGGLVAYMADVMPIIATGLTALWFLLQILEKVTGRTTPALIACLWNRIRGLR